VPFIAIKGQATTHEQVIEKLRSATRKIADSLSNEGR
jgi:hypothetical protein